MLWSCFQASDDEPLPLSDADNVQLRPDFTSHSLTDEPVVTNQKSNSQSFSKFAWHALKDLSLHQVLQTSQSYIRLHLTNCRPANEKTTIQPNFQDRDMSWSLLCLVPNRADQIHNPGFNPPISPRQDSSSGATENSVSDSLVNEILDEHDKELAAKYVNTTTDDGFKALSRKVMSQKVEIDFKENEEKEMLFTFSTTDDCMQKLVDDCMSIPKNKEDGHTNEAEGEKEEETEEKEGEDKHKAANDHMLIRFSEKILESNLTPGFVSITPE